MSQPVVVQNDNTTLLYLHTGGIATPYDGATAYTSVANCVETNNPNGENLLQYLVYDYVPVGEGHLGMKFYKQTATSSKHHVTVNWVDANGIRTLVNLTGTLNNRPLTVSENPPGGLAGGVTTYTYQGGSVRIQRLSARKAPTLTCDNSTDVVVHFTRP